MKRIAVETVKRGKYYPTEKRRAGAIASGQTILSTYHVKTSVRPEVTKGLAKAASATAVHSYLITERSKPAVSRRSQIKRAPRRAVALSDNNASVRRGRSPRVRCGINRSRLPPALRRLVK